MARPKKIGLDYFPMDVTFNDQVHALESLHGNSGLVWLIKFWQAAYKSEFGEVNLKGLFGDISANNSRTTPEQQRTIISDCIELGLIIRISTHVFSSNGVKKRISSVSGEREKALNRRKNELFAEQSPNNPQTMGESKVKESKVKEIRSAQIEKSFSAFWEIYPTRDGKKIGKKNAFSFFRKIPNAYHDRIIKNAQNYAESGQRAKDAERFLRDGYWEEWDEPARAESTKTAGPIDWNSLSNAEIGRLERLKTEERQP